MGGDRGQHGVGVGQQGWAEGLGWQGWSDWADWAGWAGSLARWLKGWAGWADWVGWAGSLAEGLGTPCTLHAYCPPTTIDPLPLRIPHALLANPHSVLPTIAPPLYPHVVHSSRAGRHVLIFYFFLGGSLSSCNVRLRARRRLIR